MSGKYFDVTVVVREEREASLRCQVDDREIWLPKSRIGGRRVLKHGAPPLLAGIDRELKEGEALEEIELETWLAVKEGLV